MAVVWLGHDEPQSLGSRESGGGLALPVWIDFMAQALKGVPVAPPAEPPEGVVRLDDDWVYSEWADGSFVAGMGLDEPGLPAEAASTASRASAVAAVVAVAGVAASSAALPGPAGPTPAAPLAILPAVLPPRPPALLPALPPALLPAPTLAAPTGPPASGAHRP